MVPETGRDIHFFLVEDNPQDARLLQEAFREVGARPRVTHCTDADAAMYALEEMLQKGGRLPDLVLLDLKLPGASGHEFLERLRGVPGLQTMPVIILSSSQHEADVQRARNNRAVAYFAKPLTLEGYMGFANDLLDLLRSGKLQG